MLSLANIFLNTWNLTIEYPKEHKLYCFLSMTKKLSEYNLKIAEIQKEKGQDVVYVKIKELLDPRL